MLDDYLRVMLVGLALDVVTGPADDTIQKAD